jgi:uncharacterized membrane protein YidH (DUF202 family)
MMTNSPVAASVKTLGIGILLAARLVRGTASVLAFAIASFLTIVGVLILVGGYHGWTALTNQHPSS